MLLNDFYKILEINTEGQAKNIPEKFHIKIELNQAHKIYDGHFPDNPVVPGVCLVQIVKEVLSEIVKNELFLFKANNIKFLSVINPEIDKVFEMEYIVKFQENNIIQVNNVIFSKEKVFFKFQGSFLFLFLK